MAISSTLFMAQFFKEGLFKRDWEYYKSISESKWYEFKLNVNNVRTIREGYTKEQIDKLKKLSQVQDVSFKQVLYSKLKFNKKKSNGINGQNYIRFMNEEGFLNDSGKGKFRPVLDMKVGDKIKVTIPKEGYANGMDNSKLLANHEKYKSQYIDKEFTIIGIIDVLPDKDEWHCYWIYSYNRS
jgi:hypothetical protein